MTMIGIVDLHSHILPYVDDGALRKEESDMLIGMLYSQGVRISCATPHLRKGMFETSDEDILKQFEKLEESIDSCCIVRFSFMYWLFCRQATGRGKRQSYY